MEPYLESYIDYLRSLHDEAQAAISGLPDEALDWTPVDGANSLGVMVVHICGAERYWIGEVLAGEPSGRDRESEFRTKGGSVEELSKMLSDNLLSIRKSLEPLKIEDLQSERLHPRTGKVVTAGWFLVHALSHTSVHIGHMQLTRQSWDQRR